ncbi:MAG: hypothetical protein EP300_08000 [Gammaproteobacteria bacterium]|nr:MAG: hypothetical protein EP300_08000 [Gammaproteobacteria bacterium]
MYQLIIRWQLLNRPALIAIGLLLLCLFLPSKSFLAESSRLIIKGSTSILPIASEIGREFQNRHPGVEVSVSGGGSLAGLQALIAGEAQIATSSIFIPEQEIQEAWRRNVYPVPFRIAYDCILPIVNVSNPVTNLSLSPLKKKYISVR